MNLEQLTAAALIEFYREHEPALINAVAALKVAGQSPAQIEREMKRRGKTPAKCAELYLIAKYLQVFSKDKSS